MRDPKKGDGVSKKILIVDDMSSVRMLVKTFLRGEDYEMEEATNGREGLAKALANPPPDLVLLDIVMPEINGIQCCQMIKNKNKNLPVVMLTTRGEEKHIEEARAAGADDYLTKPIESLSLLNAIRKHLCPSGATNTAKGEP